LSVPCKEPNQRQVLEKPETEKERTTYRLDHSVPVQDHLAFSAEFGVSRLDFLEGSVGDFVDVSFLQGWIEGDCQGLERNSSNLTLQMQ
jgi:hypothetical protein